MPHGQRDWGNVGADKVIHGLSDMAELAARMASPVTFNREGYVIFIESFEYGLGGWEYSKGGADGDIYPSAEAKRSGAYSCKLIAGPAASSATLMFRKLPYSVLGRFGLELSCKFMSGVERLRFRLVYHDPPNDHIFDIVYWLETDILTLTNDQGDYITIASNLNLHPTYSPFQTLKLVADFENDLYQRLIVNETEYDISAYAPELNATSDAETVRVMATVYNLDDEVASVYIDDLIVTQNEP